MLDDLKLIHEKDTQDALGIAEKQWQQLEYGFDIPAINAKIDNIVFAGMGGSALGALLSTTWPGYTVPFEICRSYNIPAYVSGKTLFIASSYSGNTEETIAALHQAEANHAVIVVIAGGGKLRDLAEEKGHIFVQLPPASQPRYAALYGLKALVAILQKCNLLHTGDVADISETAAYIKNAALNWRADVPKNKNLAKQIALDVIGTSPVIYASNLLYPAAYKWKISFNENAKNVAWCNVYPEFNHNEFLGWSSHPIDKPYSVIDLRSSFDHPRIQKRFDLSAKLLSGKRPAPISVELQGDTLLEQLLWAMVLGDFVTIYTALLNGVNPSPVDLVEKLKKELA